MEAVPAVGSTSPIRILTVVVLPAPFGPRKPNTSPGATVSDRSCRTVVPRYALRSPTVSIAGTLAARSTAATGASAESICDTFDLLRLHRARDGVDAPVTLPERRAT